MKILNRFSFFIYFIFYFLLFFISGLYLYYKYKYPAPYINSELYSLYPEDIILKTGGLLTQPQKRFQHFLNFSSKKSNGAIRIGAFGDSHTFGDEVGKHSAYPYYLQALFNKNFPKYSIEVLNFGISAVGFPEQFFLWEKYAKVYQLDYILLGPAGFYSNRNTRFVFHSFNVDRIPKNRFILTDNHKLKEVHIKGDTLQERFKSYYSLAPSWTALHYDKQPFKIYEMLFPFLRYKVKNPFYYTKISEDEEAVKINTKLLEKINKIYFKKILFFTNKEKLYKLYKPYSHLYNLNLISPVDSFYKVFSHESSLGNELIAQFYFNALLGKTSFFLNIIRCYFKDNKGVSYSSKLNFSKKIGMKSNHLDSADSIKILGRERGGGGGGNPLFNLRINILKSHYINGSYKNHKTEGTKSFLTFLDKNNFLRSVYIPIPFQLKEGMKVYIQLKNKKQINLGSIESLDTYSHFFVLYVDYLRGKIDHSYTHYFIYFSERGLKIKITKPAELFIGNYKLGQVISEQVYRESLLKFIPAIGYEKTFLMMGPQNFVEEKDFSKKFPVYIKYETKEGDRFKSAIPNWICKKEKQKINLDLPHFEPLKL